MPQEGVREAAEQGLTLAQLVALVGSPSGATAASLATVLRQEVAAGRVEYSPTSRRYSLAGGLDLETRQALLLLDLPGDDLSGMARRPRDPFRAGRQAATWV